MRSARRSVSCANAPGRAPFGVNLWLHPDLQPPIAPARLPSSDVDAVNAALNPARRAVGVA
jgi:hypothetical protein